MHASSSGAACTVWRLALLTGRVRKCRNIPHHINYVTIAALHHPWPDTSAALQPQSCSLTYLASLLVAAVLHLLQYCLRHTVADVHIPHGKHVAVVCARCHPFATTSWHECSVPVGQPLAAKAKGRQARCGVGEKSVFILSWGLC